MSEQLPLREVHRKGEDVVFQVGYRRSTGEGVDEVLQHKLRGVRETAHVTLHPDGNVNVTRTVGETGWQLGEAVLEGLPGYTPGPSRHVRALIARTSVRREVESRTAAR